MRELVVVNKATSNTVIPSERIRNFLVTVVGLSAVILNETINAYAMVIDNQTAAAMAMSKGHFVLENVLGNESSTFVDDCGEE